MPYKFTIVNQRTGEPIKGEINFRVGGQTTLQGWPVPLLGIEMSEELVEGYDDIIVSAPGYGTYGAPVIGLYGETEFRLVKNAPVLMWAVVAAAAAALAVSAYFEYGKPNKRHA